MLASRLGGLRTATVSVRWPSTSPPSGCSTASATAYVECAQACGLALLGGPPTVRTALEAHSTGVGQLIDAAIAAGAQRIVVGLGGSGCTDGGRALVDALGGLCAARARLADVELIAATDVEHPLLGSMGAAAVFGPQKGADPATVVLLEARLTEGSAELNAVAGRDVGAEPGAGAAGASVPRFWRWAAAGNLVPRSSPNTPTWPMTLPPPSW